MEFLTKFCIICLCVATATVAITYVAQQHAPPDTITVEDYTGKVLQVDHYTHTSGGIFSTSSREDTYVTFDNGKTYWIPGFNIIIEGNTYQVHSVKTTSYGINAWPNGTSVTRTENKIFSIEGK